MLELKHITKVYEAGTTQVEALKGIDIAFRENEFVAILGQSGCGKTTLLNIIGGIDSADAGFISIGGDKLEDMGEKALTQYRRKHLGYVFQLYNLIANLNVKENIEVGAYLSDAPLDIDELLHTLGLYEHRHKLPNQLSGGQQQRVSIGRAIVKNPDILLCDEPTGALDYATGKQILALLQDQSRKNGMTVVIITHNSALTAMADRVIGIRNGEKMYETLLTNEECAKAEDMGDFYRVPADNRSLNYDQFFTEGDAKRCKLSEFNSDNTRRLNLEETKSKIASLEYIQNELNGIMNIAK